MKKFYEILYLVLVFGLFSCTATQNTRQTKPKNETPPELAKKSTFDQKLADSLGADKMGMKNYMLVILKTGPKDKEITDKAQRSELFKGHFSNMEVMEKAGKLKLAGPFATKNGLGYRGVFLLDVKTEEEAKTLLAGDPTIKTGIFEVEILPWYGSAAIPMHIQYHKKIQKENL